MDANSGVGGGAPLLREGFADVSFRLGRTRGAKAIGVAMIFPVALGLIAYGAAWASGLVQFHRSRSDLSFRTCRVSPLLSWYSRRTSQ